MMKGNNVKKLSIATLSNFSVIGFGLGIYEGRISAFVFAALAFLLARHIAKGLDNDAC